jgi:hypothetical protein
VEVAALSGLMPKANQSVSSGGPSVGGGDSNNSTAAIGGGGAYTISAVHNHIQITWLPQNSIFLDAFSTSSSK